MSDMYIPGVKSRIDSSKLIEDLMKLERVPKERAEKNVETLKVQKSTWQDVGRRLTTLRESARALYSFQNPFSERLAKSADEAVLTATVTREASQQERTFTVQQVAQADRFLSGLLEDAYPVPAGDYLYTVGKESIAFTFRGGSLKDFSAALNRRGKDLLRADIIMTAPGKKSLLIETLATGSENRLGFSKAAGDLALATGMAERIDGQQRNLEVAAGALRSPQGAADAALVVLEGDVLRVAAGGASRLPVSPGIRPSGSLALELEAATVVRDSAGAVEQGPPPGPAIPAAGSASYGGVTVENDPSTVPLPPWTPPPVPPRVDNHNLLVLSFSDGGSATLPPVADSADFQRYRYRLGDFAGGKEIIALDILNTNTHRDVSVKNVRIFDPEASGGFKLKNPISTAKDAILAMDGIKVQRPGNDISDLIPGLTLSLHGTADKPVKLTVEPDRDAAKEAIIALVGNYNRLVADINVLTRTDDKIIEELSYLNTEEREGMTKKLGTMQGDSTLNQFKANLQRAAASTYPTSAERDMALLTQIGVSTDARRSGGGQGYDASRLRGYLEIDEKTMDAALRADLPAIRELFGNDTDGDLIVDAGFAFSLDSLVKPYVETGGIITLKTGTIDSRLTQEQRRIDTLEVQLADKEDSLKREYGMMEGALGRMQQTSNSIDQFSSQSKQ